VIRYAVELLRSLVKSERGQDLTEYALVTGLVAIAAIVGVTFLGAAFLGWFNDMGAWVNTLTP
jgi:Flp pilus assembly pilin Flp